MFSLNLQLKKIKEQNQFFLQHLILILIFAIIYYLIGKYHIKEDNEDKKFNNFFECFFYSFMLQYTIGFVFLMPNSKILKVFSMFQVLCAHILFSV